MNEAARENGYLRDTPPFLSEDDAADLPDDEVLLLCTGSQGEPRAALSRIASGTHPSIMLESGDAVIFSSRIIPGNERSIGRLQDQLVRLGVEVLTEQNHFVHVSGHPARDELARMYAHVRPQVAIPVHGELRHLVEHAQLARDCQVPVSLVVENGSVVRLGPGAPMIIDQVHSGRLGLDGNRLVPMDGTVVRDRQRMVDNGAAVATLVLDRDGRLVAEPVVTVHGLLDPEGDGALDASLRSALRDAVGQMPPGSRRDDGAVREVARSVLRRVLKRELGRRPVTEIHLVRV